MTQRLHIPKDWDEFDDHHPAKVVKRRIPVDVVQLGVPVLISTLEGDMKAEPGDILARGIKGEFYPIRHDVFMESYEPYDPKDSAGLKMSREIFEFLKAAADMRRAIDEYGTVFLHDPEAASVADMYSSLDLAVEKAWDVCKGQVAELIGV